MCGKGKAKRKRREEQSSMFSLSFVCLLCGLFFFCVRPTLFSASGREERKWRYEQRRRDRQTFLAILWAQWGFSRLGRTHLAWASAWFQCNVATLWLPSHAYTAAARPLPIACLVVLLAQSTRAPNALPHNLALVVCHMQSERVCVRRCLNFLVVRSQKVTKKKEKNWLLWPYNQLIRQGKNAWNA